MQGEEVQLCGVIVNPTTVTGRTATVQGTVILTGPAPNGGANVVLSSDNPDVVKVQPSVDVPAGSDSAGFTVNTEPVNNPTPVAITASIQDVKRTATLTVQPPALTQLTLNPTVVLGGATARGTVQLNGPAPANFVVALQSTNTLAATVQPSVTVPTDSTSATFPVNARPVSSTRQVDIVASRAGVARSATLIVRSPAPVAFAFSPQSIEGGGTSTGTIGLNGPAPGGTSVALLSPITATVDFPATVSVPPDATQVTFQAIGRFFTGPDRSVNVTASYLGGTRVATLRVQGSIALNSIAVNPTAVVGRTTTVQGVVTLAGPAPPGGLSVALSSANPAVVRVPSSVNVPAGSTTAQFPVNTEPVSSPTPVAITASIQDVKRTATLTVQPPALTQLTLNPTTVLGGTAPPQGTVHLNGPAPAGFAVSLQSTEASVAMVPAEVTVPQDAISSTFPVNARPVSSSRQVDIVASRVGVVVSATLTVQSPVPVAFTLFPPTITGAQTSRGTISLNGPAPSGTSVALKGSNATTADFPATVLVQPNATQIFFAAQGKSFSGADRSVTITASYLGGTQSATLTVRKTKGKEKDKEVEKAQKEKEKEGKEKEEEKATQKEKEEEKAQKDKEDESLVSGRSGVEGPGAAEGEIAGTDEEGGEPGGAEEGPAPGRAFVQPDERPGTGQQALDRPPAE